MLLKQRAKECILRATCLCHCSKTVSSLEMINGEGFLGVFYCYFLKGGKDIWTP